MAVDDFIMTIDSGDELDTYDVPIPVKKTGKGVEVDESLNPDFIFDPTGDPYVDIIHADVVETGTKPVSMSCMLNSSS